MQATIDGVVIAEATADALVRIEGTWYFPPAALAGDHLRPSETPYTCPWKGVARYYDVVVGTHRVRDGAWCYPQPRESAIARVGADFSEYVAFDAGQVSVG